MFQNIELDIEGVATVKVFVVLAFPEEGGAGFIALESFSIYAVGLEAIYMFLVKVMPDNTN